MSEKSIEKEPEEIIAAITNHLNVDKSSKPENAREIEESVQAAYMEMTDIDAFDALSDLLKGFHLWYEARFNSTNWTDEDEQFVRWIKGGEVGKLL